MLKNKTISELTTEAERRLFKKRFCTSCQKLMPLEGGQMTMTKVNRWKCAICLNKGIIHK